MFISDELFSALEFCRFNAYVATKRGDFIKTGKMGEQLINLTIDQLRKSNLIREVYEIVTNLLLTLHLEKYQNSKLIEDLFKDIAIIERELGFNE